MENTVDKIYRLIDMPGVVYLMNKKGNRQYSPPLDFRGWKHKNVLNIKKR